MEKTLYLIWTVGFFLIPVYLLVSGASDMAVVYLLTVIYMHFGSQLSKAFMKKHIKENIAKALKVWADKQKQ